MDTAFIKARIAALEAALVAYEDALLALASGAQDYMIDTGQTRQRVTKLDLKDLNAVVSSLVNQIEVYETRLNGNGISIGRPAW